MKKGVRPIDANVLSEEISSLRVAVTGMRAGKGILAKMMQEYRESVLRIIDEQNTLKMDKPYGELLTLEQLRGMDGKCVKVVVDGVEPLEMLALVEVPKDEDCVLLRNNLGGVSEFYSDDDLLEDSIKVYAYPNAHIDREAWEPCGRCRPVENEFDRFSGHEFLIDGAEIYFYDSEDGWEGEEIRFCPWCGRPLTEEAWAELEKRVRGI